MSRDLIENSTVTDVVETFATLYGAQKLISVFTGTRHGASAEHKESTENVINI
jgi:hypothetical protein